MVAKSVPLFTARLVEAALRRVAVLGGSPERVRVRAGLSSATHFSDALIEFSAIARVLACAADETKDPCFGLNLGANVDLRVFGTIAFAVANAPTVGTALGNLIRYQNTYSRNFRCFYERDDTALAGFQLEQSPSEGLRHLENLCIAVVVCNLQKLIGERWQPLAMKFEHADPHLGASYEAVIGCPPQYGCERAELSISLALDEEPIPFADRRLLPVVKQHLGAWASEQNDAEPVLRDVREEIAKLLCDGTPQIDSIARKLNMSTRTLQRKLSRHDTSYRALLTDVRKHLVTAFLRNTKMGLLEISLLLGYADQSAFDHAFRDWFGVSPSEFRRDPGTGG